MTSNNSFKQQPNSYASAHHKNAAGVVPKVEKNGNIEVFQYPDKPDGTKGMRGFRVRFNFWEVE